jgi:hypothetical protein
VPKYWKSVTKMLFSTTIADIIDRVFTSVTCIHRLLYLAIILAMFETSASLATDTK